MRQELEMSPGTITAPGVPDALTGRAQRSGTLFAADEVANYQRLKKLDELLDVYQEMTYRAQHDYQKTLHRFATECHQLWQQEKAQGSRQGKGFRQRLQNEGIKAGRAYRAMKKFFPADFPSRKPAPVAVSSRRRGGTLSAADEVSLRFTGQRLRPGGNGKETREVLQCIFGLTAKEKAEFLRCIKVVGAPQVQRLLLEAVKQAADAIRGERAQKHSHENQDGSNIKKKRKIKAAPSLQHSSAAQDRDDAISLPAGNETTGNERAKMNAVDIQPSPPPEQVLCTATTYDGFVRLTRLHDNLQLQGAHPDLLSVACQYPPMSLKARLDWVDTHPDWVAKVRGKPVLQFIQAFQEDTFPW
ncbi:MAG TPA: hypothetical protein VKY85_23635 [Candidatus Angelobacter sp.]|nr:hypothetical protein [Candidatus Angelobacter sp.]